MSNVLGHRSKKVLLTTHVDMQLIIATALTDSPIDFSIVHGARTAEKQLEYFLDGKSKLDPRVPESVARAMHVITPERPKAMAVDIALYVPGRNDLAYHRESMSVVAGHIIGTANRLYREGKVSYIIRWGGNWDGDAEMLTDQKFDDLPHFELFNPKNHD